MQNLAVVFNEVMKWRTKETGMLEGRIENLYIIGGTGAVSDDVAAEAAYWSQMKDVRIAGKDRYETNVTVNKMLYSGSANKSICVATGCDFPDALVGGAGCLIHGEKNKAQVDAYGREALEKNISDAVSVLTL